MVYLQVFAGLVDGISVGVNYLQVALRCKTACSGLLTLFVGSALHSLLEQLEHLKIADH
jgi:hypothetical protein